MGLSITAVSYALPSDRLTNEALAADLGQWTPAQITEKTGITERRIASSTECASDLATAAAQRLFDADVARPETIDFAFFVTQSPDYFLPPSACLMHARLGLPKTSACFDINLGCSGYVYALAVAAGWIAAGLGSTGLVLTGDTYSRFIRPTDRATRPIFGDAGTATLVEASVPGGACHSFVLGTDGSGADRLVVEAGGMRCLRPWSSGDEAPQVTMDGPAIFTFTLDVVPPLVDECLRRAGLSKADIDLFLLHQANSFMVSHLISKMGLDPSKSPIEMADYGNTVSSTIPILIADLAASGRLNAGARTMLVGFGVGLSWGACIMEVPASGVRGLPHSDL